ncbi:MAG: helix-turn-helix domain-containing protein [Actinomycetes bacterium]|jgi:DNA-binding PucR family transcriptional regulator
MASVSIAHSGGLEALLASLGPADTLNAFAQRHLSPIDTYDRQRGTALMTTLEAFLDAGASLEATASRLGTHRNTVRYRLRCIAGLIDRDIHDPRVALELHLALRIRQSRPPASLDAVP